jgi:hypothetical protein
MKSLMIDGEGVTIERGEKSCRRAMWELILRSRERR